MFWLIVGAVVVVVLGLAAWRDRRRRGARIDAGGADRMRARLDAEGYSHQPGTHGLPGPGGP